jgi:RNA-directed DNA polymerase
MTVTIDQLRSATSYLDFGLLFGVSHSRLASSLYGRASSYRTFAIPKKSGGHRLIESPVKERRSAQKVLAEALNAHYRPTKSAHGFVAGRSVVTNARAHVAKSIVVNVDLLDFFPSITFQRVRGIFLAQPLGFGWFSSNVLAQLVCCNGRLPAGGVTSPVVSNIVLSGLDKSLAALAARYGGAYTRYADDLTFSFDRSPSQLGSIVTRQDSGEWVVGPSILDLVSKNGFSLNTGKTRIRFGGSRKAVTGVVVNQKTNVPRKWLRDLDRNIYVARKYGLSSAAAKMFPSLDQGVAERRFLRKIHGQISYMRMIRGAGDWLTADIAFKFNEISESPLRVPDVEIVRQQNRTTRSVLTVFGYKAKPADPLAWDEVGTAFVYDKGLIVTAAHVLMGGNKVFPYVLVSHPHAPAKRFECNVVAIDVHRDIAVLDLSQKAHSLSRIRFEAGHAPSVGDSVISVGFPGYFFGGKHHIQQHGIAGSFVASGIQKHSITGTVVGGLSGGPVLNAEYQVVGLVHRGVAAGGHGNEIISIAEIEKVVAAI